MMSHRMPISALALAIASVAFSQAQAQSTNNYGNQGNSQGQNSWQQQDQQQARQQGQQGQQQAQQQQGQQGQAWQQQGLIRPLGQWNYSAVYQRGQFLGDNLLGNDVIGQNGQDIGDISNAVLNEQNRIIALIAEVGGFWDIGDTHVIVPWNQARFSRDGVYLPINEDNVEQYNLYGENSVVTKRNFQQKAAIEDDAETGQRTWKLTELLNDYSNLQGGVGYGYVDNAIFSRNGELLAVLIMPSGTTANRGTAAYPFYGYGYGWQPGYSSYELPYTQNAVNQMPAFNYERFNGFWEGS